MPVPDAPKIYHILHVDRLPSVIEDGHLWCDAEIVRRSATGTSIGMSQIKRRRLEELKLRSHPKLMVGDCVPFYFCPRSVMLYLIYRANDPGLEYKGGQGPIVHLEADLKQTVEWARTNNRRWAFTLSNAGAKYFEDLSDLEKLDQVDWTAVNSTQWSHCKEGKQAEFLLERKFPWQLISRVGVHSKSVQGLVARAFRAASHRPRIEIMPSWYY